MTEILEIYKALPRLLLPWYKENARELPWRRYRDPYRVWVSEIMLQQTRVEAVIGYYERFMNAFPNVKVLAEAEEVHVLKLWEGLGYYSRARNLQKAAKIIAFELGGKFPDTAESLLKLPGIGAYTAGAVASICFEQPSAAVDGNVLRIITRMTADERAIDLNITKQDIAFRLEEVYPKGNCGDFTQALMELGACVCTPKSPKCAECPMRDICKAHAMKKETAFPVKLPKKEKRVEERTVFLLKCGERYAVCQREEKGLLAGLWQFPNCSGSLSAEEAVLWAKDMKPRELIKEVHRTHIFTHIRWEMTGYLLSCDEAAAPYSWVPRAELEKKYTLPTAFRMFLSDLPKTKE